MSKLFGSVIVLVLGASAGCGGGGGGDSQGDRNAAGGTNGGGAGNVLRGGSDSGGMNSTLKGSGGMKSTLQGNGGSSSSNKRTVSLTVSAPSSTLVPEACGAVAAGFANVAAGTYDIELSASTLSKGTVSDDNNNLSPSFDNYVLVNLPLPAGADNEDLRFFMLHGVGDKVSVELPEAGPINLYFIDGDKDFNTGQATVSLTSGAQVQQAVVDAAANVIAWKTGCKTSAPATAAITDAPQRVTLMESTFSSATQMSDPFVLLRLSNEMQANDNRFTMLNGIGSSVEFTPYEGDTLRAWLLSSKNPGSGAAQLTISEL
ncbi:MAG: hypothetical protein ACOY0T_17230 [Myxococcota bacterium]